MAGMSDLFSSPRPNGPSFANGWHTMKKILKNAEEKWGSNAASDTIK